MIQKYSQLKKAEEVSRFNPRGRILFLSPLVGPSGSSVIAYERKWKIGEKEHPTEGLIEKKVSDWDIVETGNRGMIRKYSELKQMQGSRVINGIGETKIIDEKGFPKILFHGTLSTFEKFSNKFSGKKDRSVTAYFGLFFTEDEKVALKYAKWNQGSGKIISARLVIKNPYEMSYEEFDSFAMYEFNKMKESSFKFSDKDVKKWRKEAISKVKIFRENLIKQGHDGIIVKTDSSSTTEYIVFNPQQVKIVESKRASCKIAHTKENEIFTVRTLID